MPTGYEGIDPLGSEGDPPTMEQRMSAFLAPVRQRLETIMRERPVTSVGTIDPSGIARAGTRYMDTDDRRFYVYANGQWISADSQRWTVSDATQVSTTGARWQGLGGPDLTFTLPTPGIILIHVDVEIWAAAWACGFGTCLTRAEVGLNIDDAPTGYATTRILKSSNNNAWERRASTGRQDAPTTRESLGAIYPLGGFSMHRLGSGTHTATLHYAAADETPGGGWPTTTVFFRNRAIHALFL